MGFPPTGLRGIARSLPRNSSLTPPCAVSILSVVVIRSEDKLAMVASSDDVIEPALDFESRLPYNAVTLPQMPLVVNCKLHACSENRRLNG
jgi:hypothetical protein